MKQIILLSIVLSAVFSSLQAQDPILSQYYANKMYLNPALTGFEGGITVNTNYRNQWFRVDGADAEFTTKAVGIDFEAPCLQSSFGINYIDNLEGAGDLRRQSAGISYAWRSRPEQGVFQDKFELSFGMRGVYSWQSLNWDRLVFSDQLTPFGPTGGASGLDRPDNLGGGYFDFGAGTYAMWTTDNDHRIRLGASFQHIVRIDPSLVLIEDTLPIRTTIHGSYVLPVMYGSNRKYELIPMFKLDMQRSAVASITQAFWYTSIQYGVAFNFLQKPGLWGGAWLNSHTGKNQAFPDGNNINSLIVALGVEFGEGVDLSKSDNSYRFGVSYDYNMSGIRSDGGGTFELSFTANFGKAKIIKCDKRPANTRVCPKF